MDKERVIIYIDGSNFYHLTPPGFRVDFDRLARSLTAGQYLVRTYYYNACRQDGSETYKNSQRFFDYLGHLQDFKVKLGRVEFRGTNGDGTPILVEKGIDTQIVVDMLLGAVRDTYDVAILLSGDADFAGAVEAVKEMGKKVYVAHFRGVDGVAHALINAADRDIIIDETEVAKQ
jgi:uncharacterized LabA/DUF88 family protein